MLEIRVMPANIRAQSTNGKPQITGTAVVYNQLSQEMYDPRVGKFREVILPGALRSVLANDKAEVKADVNHATEQVIGRRSKGTLRMQDAENGLNVDIDPPDTTWGRDAVEAINSGNYDGMSFEFSVNKGGERYYRDSNGGLIRELSDINLKRVSVVAEPAYDQTEVSLRSIDAATEFLAIEKEKESVSNITKLNNILAAVAAGI